MPGSYDTRDPVVADADGTEAYLSVPCIAGASRSVAVLKMLAPTMPGRLKVYSLPVGQTTLTLALLASGVLQSVNPSASSILVPTLASLGWTYNAALQLAFPVQRGGLGLLAVNAASGVTIADPNNISPVNLGRYHSVVWVVLDGVDSWHYE